MNQHVRVLSDLSNASSISMQKTGNSLFDTIQAFESGWDFVHRIKGLEDDEFDALMASICNPLYERLSEWEGPAISRQSAIAALRLAVKENERFGGSSIVNMMTKTALDFFEKEEGRDDSRNAGRAAQLDLGLDMSKLTIVELVTTFEGLQTLSRASGE